MRKIVLRLVAPVILMVSLTACETGSSNPTTSICPAIVEYSRAFQMRAADELIAALDAEFVALPQMMVDYGQLRDRLRACRNE